MIRLVDKILGVEGKPVLMIAASDNHVLFRQLKRGIDQVSTSASSYVGHFSQERKTFRHGVSFIDEFSSRR